MEPVALREQQDGASSATSGAGESSGRPPHLGLEEGVRASGEGSGEGEAGAGPGAGKPVLEGPDGAHVRVGRPSGPCCRDSNLLLLRGNSRRPQQTNGVAAVQ